MSQPDGNYVPKKRAPFIYYTQPESESPLSITVTVRDDKRPIGFADWPEEPKTKWEKA